MTNENDRLKLLMLYIFREFDVEIEESDARGVLVATDEFPQMELEVMIDELVASEQLFRLTKNGKGYCGITELGRQTIDELIDDIPEYVRKSAIGKAIRHFNYIHGRELYYTRREKCEFGGEYIVCGFKKHDRVIMETKIRFESPEDLRIAEKTCRDRPEMLYNGLRAIVLGDINYL